MTKKSHVELDSQVQRLKPRTPSSVDRKWNLFSRCCTGFLAGIGEPASSKQSAAGIQI